MAIAGVVLISTLLMAPSNAEDQILPVTTAEVATFGTINVLSLVLNDNLGTNSANDFVFSVRHWGVDVVGSPFSMAGGMGISLELEPGTYVVSTPIIDGYNGVWFGDGISDGFIDLQAGQSITIKRISDDVGVADVVTPAPEVPETVPTLTEVGGTLPSTASPWFNGLAAGLILSAAGAFGLGKSMHFK